MRRVPYHNTACHSVSVAKNHSAPGKTPSGSTGFRADPHNKRDRARAGADSWQCNQTTRRIADVKPAEFAVLERGASQHCHRTAAVSERPAAARLSAQGRRAQYRDTCRLEKRQIRGATGQFRKGNRVSTVVAKRGLQDAQHVQASGSFVGSLRSLTGRKLFTSFSLRARSQSGSPLLTMTIWRVGFSSASWSSRVNLPV